ncbi:MAG: DNA N-6-adenine-methyltransferase [Terriglobia bacterium]|jgi:hypothetical protein
MHWSHDDNFGTPEYLRSALEREFGLDYDPCPLASPPVKDGLAADWTGKNVFCNPPWSKPLPWVKKALASRCLTVFVLPARTDTAWFHLLKDAGAELRFFRKRVHFVKEGVRKNPTDGTLVAIVRGKK